MSNQDRKEHVICPYLKTVYKNAIVCEAAVGREMALRFHSIEKRSAYQERVCSSWDYEICPYAGLLTRLYEENEK